MRFLRKMRADLSSGENLEIYATGVLSLVLAVLGVLGVVDSVVLAAAILATLALLAGGMLESRRQVDDLSALVRARDSGPVSALDYLTGDKPGLLEEVSGAQDIRIVGVTLSRTLRNLVDELRRCASAGAVIQVALIDPTTTAPVEAARRSTVPYQSGVFENRLRPSIDLLRDLVSNDRDLWIGLTEGRTWARSNPTSRPERRHGVRRGREQSQRLSPKPVGESDQHHVSQPWARGIAQCPRLQRNRISEYGRFRRGECSVCPLGCERVRTVDLTYQSLTAWPETHRESITQSEPMFYRGYRICVRHMPSKPRS